MNFKDFVLNEAVNYDDPDRPMKLNRMKVGDGLEVMIEQDGTVHLSVGKYTKDHEVMDLSKKNASALYKILKHVYGDE